MINVFIREAPIEENIVSECIRTVAATYGCKFYNYANTMRTCTDTMRTANDLINVFIREAPIEENIVSECIRTIAATYGCKILQLCKYNANVYGYDANCE